MAKPDTYPCDKCGTEIKQTPGPGRIRRTCEGGCKTAPAPEVSIEKKYAQWKIREARTPVQEITIAQTRGYILALEDVLKDMAALKKSDQDYWDIETAVRQSLREAQDTLNRLLPRGQESKEDDLFSHKDD